MGKIVMPKNSALLHEIESVLQIYYEANDWIPNSEYKVKLKAMIGDDQYPSSYTKKAQITSYFGFIIWEDINNPQSKRKITPSGKRMYEALKAGNTAAIQEVLMNSLETVKFGRDNYGCPESSSDIEPPSLYVRAILDMGYLTYREFAYLLWKLEDLGFNYTDVIAELKNLRGEGTINLGEEANKYADCKPIMILVRWGFLAENETDSSGGKHIIIAPEVFQKYENRLRNLKIYNVDMSVYNDILVNSNFDDISLEENKKQFRDWLSKQHTINGTLCTPSMVSNNCSALKKVCKLMKFSEYTDLASIFEIVDMDTFVQVKNLIMNHPDYETVNKACNNRFLSTGLKWYEKYLNEMISISQNNILENTAKYKKILECSFDAQITSEYINLIVYGTPGCGKSWYVKNNLLKDYKPENIIRTTFYQDYTNTDFVGQIMPIVSGEDVTYKFNPGPFTIALRKAIEVPNEPVALVIEELNRGNAPSIFGDIFQLLDRENGKSEYRITNVNVQKYLSDIIPNMEFNFIMLPANLSIIATMNTSDQNVFTLDTAFKRRWDFKKLKNKFKSDHPYKGYLVPGMNNITWEMFVNDINNFIENSSDLQSEDKQLGVFFVSRKLLCKNVRDITNELKERFAYKVLEYLWDDVAKFDRDNWFNSNIKSLDKLVEGYVKSGKEVFKDGIFGKYS